MKNFKLNFGLGFFILIILIGGCTPYNPLRDVEAFASELETNSSTYTVDDWKGAFQTYEGIIASMEGIELSEDETKEFGRLNGICTAQLAKGAVVLAKDVSSTGITFLEGLVEGFKSTIDEDCIEKTIELLGDKLESIIKKYE